MPGQGYNEDADQVTHIKCEREREGEGESKAKYKKLKKYQL